MAKRALITGVTGQDGSYLAEFLLEQGYTVIGMVRRSSTVTFERIAHIQDRLELVAGDLLDGCRSSTSCATTGPTRSTTWPPVVRPDQLQPPVLTGRHTALA